MAELQFTREQTQAITDRDGAILVSAAAGSGKTRVLVERLMRRVTDPQTPCNIDDFLIITFTKKAAGELRARIARALSDALALHPENRHLARQMARLGLAQITTIDGFCSDLVRANAFALDLPPDFRQMETDEAAQLRAAVASSLLDECYADIASDDAFRTLVQTLGLGRDDRELEDAVQQVYSAAQCHVFPDAWIESCIRTLELSQYDDAGQTPWGAQLIRAFARFCRGKQQVLQTALARCEAEPALQTKYAPLLARELAQLQTLGALTQWDALHAASPVFDRLPAIRGEGQSQLQAQIKQLRNDCKDALRSQLAVFSAPSAEVMDELAQTGQALVALFALVRRFGTAYLREKKRRRVLDFSDLEHYAVRLLLHENGSPRPLAGELSLRYTEIMLDEYQDTNEVQDRLFAAISREGKNLFMVGDVKQAIYRFRLADPGIFLQKYERFAPIDRAQPGSPRKILLSHNFRSDPGVLEAVNAVFSACMSKDVGELDYGEAERLRQGAPRPALPGPVTELHCVDTKPSGTEDAAPDKEAVEAAFVAARIRRLLEEKTPVSGPDGPRPVQPEDIVILLRSVSNTAQTYVAALQAEGLPCQSDRESDLFSAPEIETLLSLLRVIDNPRQDIPLLSVLMSPLIGMKADTLADIRSGNKKTGLYQTLCASDAPEAVAFVQTLRALRTAAAELELGQLLTEISAQLHLEALYGMMPNAEQRLANLQSFFALAAGFAEGGRKSLAQFLARVDTLHAEQRGEQARPGCVRLMSIHKSKGLEFPVVVLAGLSRKFNRQEYTQQVLLHPVLGTGCNVYDPVGHYRYSSMAKRAIISRLDAESRAEELRVLYVAMTRAMDRLIMTYCAGNLDKRLQTLAQRLTLPPEPLLAAEALCPGDWVLEAALLRTEAGALFAAGERPMQTQVSELPWRITYQVCPAPPAAGPRPAEEAGAQTQRPDLAALETALRFAYPHAAATQIPAKITATQLKGRRLDEEVDDRRPSGGVYTLRRPVFDRKRPLTAAERGTATHLAMQYLDFSRTNSVEEIRAELLRLQQAQFLTPAQAEAVSAERLYRIFAGPIGKKIAAADRVIREFKFSILTDASLYDPAGEGERMLLQGVTDCCLIKDGALTVIDFKTDRVKPGSEAEAARRYRGQLEAYSLALGRIFGLPVAEKLLYFFATDTPVAL